MHLYSIFSFSKYILLAHFKPCYYAKNIFFLILFNCVVFFSLNTQLFNDTMLVRKQNIFLCLKKSQITSTKKPSLFPEQHPAANIKPSVALENNRKSFYYYLLIVQPLIKKVFPSVINSRLRHLMCYLFDWPQLVIVLGKSIPFHTRKYRI